GEDGGNGRGGGHRSVSDTRQELRCVRRAPRGSERWPAWGTGRGGEDSRCAGQVVRVDRGDARSDRRGPRRLARRQPGQARGGPRLPRGGDSRGRGSYGRAVAGNRRPTASPAAGPGRTGRA